MTKQSAKKERLDQLLVVRGLAANRSRARALIMAGQVTVDDQPAPKAGVRVSVEARIALRERMQFVSRAGGKLDAFLEEYPLAIDGCVAADLGASTGGFTDCLLQRGAATVFAVDVGRGQLDQRLREDPRVLVREKINARHLEADTFGRAIDLYTMDLAFISLTLIIPGLLAAAGDGPTDLVALVKPQFEAGKKDADRAAGVIRDPLIHRRELAKVWDCLEHEGWQPLAVAPAAVIGASGNQEFLIAATTAHLPRAAPFAPARNRDQWLDLALARG